MKCPKCGFEWVRSDIEKPSKEGKPRRPIRFVFIAASGREGKKEFARFVIIRLNMAGSKWVPGHFGSWPQENGRGVK